MQTYSEIASCRQPVPRSENHAIKLCARHAFVAFMLVFWHALKVWRGADLSSFDDLARTALATGWARQPYLFTADLYWLPLPFIVRGLLVKLLGTILGFSAGPMLFAARAASMAYMFGAWILLARCLRLLGGGFPSLAFFALLYTFNFGAIDFSSTSLSEPDSLFFTSAALVLCLGAKSVDCLSTLRLWALAGVLGLASFTRYELWTVAAAFALFLLSQSPNLLRSPVRLVPLAMPLIPIAVWMSASALSLGSPFQFLNKGNSYIDLTGTENLFARSAGAVLNTNRILVLPILACATVELIRRRKDARFRLLALLLAVTGAWMIFKIWRIETTPRYVWEFFMMMGLPAGLAFERWLTRDFHGLRTLVWPVMTLGAVAGIVGVSPPPFIPLDLRNLARQSAKQAGDAAIYIEETSDASADQPFVLQTLRVLTPPAKVIPCGWIQACEEGLTAEKIALYDLRVAVSLNEPKGLPKSGTPFAGTALGWNAWIIGSGHRDQVSSLLREE